MTATTITPKRPAVQACPKKQCAFSSSAERSLDRCQDRRIERVGRRKVAPPPVENGI